MGMPCVANAASLLPAPARQRRRSMGGDVSEAQDVMNRRGKWLKLRGAAGSVSKQVLRNLRGVFQELDVDKDGRGESSGGRDTGEATYIVMLLLV